MNRKYGYRFPMPVICKKPTARTKKQRVENVEDQKFRGRKIAKIAKTRYGHSGTALVTFQLWACRRDLRYRQYRHVAVHFRISPSEPGIGSAYSGIPVICSLLISFAHGFSSFLVSMHSVSSFLPECWHLLSRNLAMD